MGSFRGSKGKRAGFWPAEYFNPSRTLALLKRRGVVERGNEHFNEGGQGAGVSLINEGRSATG